MPYAVVLYLDSKDAKPLRQTISLLAQKNIAPYMQDSSIPPHVTLAIYDELKCQTCEQKISALARKVSGFDLFFSFIGLFQTDEPVVFIAPTVTDQLLSIHHILHETLKDDAKDPWEYYLPGRWVPHCSLAVEFPPQNTMEAIQICRQLSLPLSIRVASLGVVQFQPAVPLYHYDLSTRKGNQSFLNK